MVNLNRKILKNILVFLAVSISLIGQRDQVKTEAFSSDLFIRSVSHNASSDNMLELFNGTGATVNLNTYYVSAYHNGNGTPTGTHQLPNINLPNGQAFLLAKDSSTGPYTTEERAYVASFPLKLLLPNGVGFQNAQGANDAYVLRKNSSNGTIIDVFGMVGFNPVSGTGWTEYGSNLRYGFIDPNYTLSATKLGATNYLSTLVRRPDVINPQVSSLTYTRGTTTGTSATSFKPSEWGVYNAGIFASNVYRFNLFDNVKDVIDLINNLPNPITQNDAAAVAAARTAYNNLTTAQQSTVTNYADLLADEEVIAGFAEIIEVIDLINALPSPISLSDEASIVAARTAFDVLTLSEQAQVTNANILIAAETTLANLKAVQTIIAAIAALPVPITLANENAILSIRSQYNALTLDQQALISNEAVYLNAEIELARLKQIQDVKALIAALPNPMTLAAGDDLTAARAAYNALSTANQVEVDNVNILIAAENRYLDLQAAKAVTDTIAALPEPVTLGNQTDVTLARQAYNALTSTQQGLVTNYPKLETAEALIASLLGEVDAVETLIDALPLTITIANQLVIEEARVAFNALNDAQEDLVVNEQKILDAEAALATILNRIQNVIQTIQALSSPITLADDAAVTTARLAFDGLSQDEQAKVTNANTLMLAEAVILDLKTPRYVVYYVVFNQIFTEVVKSGTGLQVIPANPVRLGFTFTGWVFEGTSTILNLASLIITSAQRIVAVFAVDNQATDSELIVDIVGLDNINVSTLYPNRDVAMQLVVELLPIVEVPQPDIDDIDNLLTTQSRYSLTDMFVLDLSIKVTYQNNGVLTEESLPEIEEAIDITVNIPTLYRQFATYQVVRVHESEAELLSTDYDPASHTLTFSTDKFSTYGVLYSNALTDDLMGLINQISQPTTLADLDLVLSIRDQFDALTPTQQAMITNVNILTSSEAILATLIQEIADVEAMIDALTSPITISQRQAIEDARTAYQALSNLQKAEVENLHSLIDAEAALLARQNEVDQLILDIQGLSVPTLMSEAIDIADIRTAYTALTSEQKNLITNLAILTNAESELATLQSEVDAVIDLIAGLNQPIRLVDESALGAAREAFDNLNAEQKTFVTNAALLTSGEADYQTLVNEINAVISSIAALPNEIQLADDADIVEARDLFDALTLEQQALINNASKLIDAETQLLIIKANINAVIALIEGFQDPIRLQDETAIVAVREAYEALTTEEKEYVDNFLNLVEAEADLQLLKDEIDAVIDLILELPSDIDVDDELDITSVRDAYETLTSEQKTWITNLNDLIEAETTLAMKFQEIADVQALIDALPEPVSMNDKALLDEIREAYENLSSFQQALVTNLPSLESQEAHYANLVVAMDVTELIEALPNAENVVLEDEAAIVAARAAYEALSEAQQALIDEATLNRLIEDEEALRQLMSPSMSFWSILPFHLASGFIIILLAYLKSKKKEA
ncbi:MAG: hypothetical protein RLZZ264_159 [Bacillota bacterium]|jgi:hypothetical protein